MIKRKGNLFDTTATAIGHGVNCDGVMGAGIALEFRTRFKWNYETYRKACIGQQLVPGTALIVNDTDVTKDDYLEYTIANLATQGRPGKDARYDAVFSSALSAAGRLKEMNEPVLALPMIGAGIGGLEWSKVETLLHAVEVLVPDFQFEVWKYE